MTSLGELMKEYEHAYRRQVSVEDYILIRLDGKSFHSYTRGLDKPFDSLFMEAMDETLLTLCREVPGVRFGYVESDEISLLITAFKNVTPSNSNSSGVQYSELWMGGVEAKLLSLTAAIATATFNKVREEQKSVSLSENNLHPHLALFDSRLWTFPGTDEGKELVKKYFSWRRRDSVKNSVTMAALTHFSHKALHRKNTEEKIIMLNNIGTPWEALPEEFRFGRYSHKVEHDETVTYLHKKTGVTDTIDVKRKKWTINPLINFLGAFTSETLPSNVNLGVVDG